MKNKSTVKNFIKNNINKPFGIFSPVILSILITSLYPMSVAVFYHSKILAIPVGLLVYLPSLLWFIIMRWIALVQGIYGIIKLIKNKNSKDKINGILHILSSIILVALYYLIILTLDTFNIVITD